MNTNILKDVQNFITTMNIGSLPAAPGGRTTEDKRCIGKETTRGLKRSHLAQRSHGVGVPQRVTQRHRARRGVRQVSQAHCRAHRHHGEPQLGARVETARLYRLPFNDRFTQCGLTLAPRQESIRG